MVGFLSASSVVLSLFANGKTGTLPLKKTQGFFGEDARFPRVVPQYGCVVLEVQDWIDGINNPAWMRLPKQVIGPNTAPYTLEATYSFSVTPASG